MTSTYVFPIQFHWILDRFLKCARTWADHIIIANQGSTDGSLEIIQHYSKVRLIETPCQEFNTGKMRQAFLKKARTITGSRIMISLDADESFSANWKDRTEWDNIKSGVIRFSILRLKI